ncbi:MAG TPA: hypothetical protein VEM15_09825 [Thermodesulfobacteriota bacterium]|nr:hypothetical protein [Thermodesulfobacteriota bacterium]
MIVYKFYLRDAIKGDIFLGSLPERRKNPRRVTGESTEESIINWGRKYFGENGQEKDIYFIKTVLEEREKQYPPSQP